MLPYAIVEQSMGKAAGMTTFMNADAVNRRVEIRSTAFRKSAQRTGLNTQSKLLMLTHTFEHLECIAVEFCTHFFNRQSRAGIEHPGAKLNGILRNHQIPADGTPRHICVYSIIASEWPTVKAHLTFQTEQPR
jgi:RimJ/RimL family protein N-acetyltransferase